MSDWEQDFDGPSASAVAATSSSSSAPVARPALAGRRRFDDEDVEDEVKDDWEEDDDEEEQEQEKRRAANAAAAVVPAKKKGSVKQKIAEKEAEHKRRAELGLDDDDEDEGQGEDAAERRRKEKEAMLKSDIDNAAALLGTNKIADDSLSALKSAKPTTKEEWESLASSLYAELLKRQSSRPGFDKHFVPALSRQLSQSLRDVDMRKMSVAWRDLAEAKVKAEKEAKRLGGRKPAGVAAASSKAKPKSVGTASAKDAIDTTPYGDEALDMDDDDFM